MRRSPGSPSHKATAPPYPDGRSLRLPRPSHTRPLPAHAPASTDPTRAARPDPCCQTRAALRDSACAARPRAVLQDPGRPEPTNQIRGSGLHDADSDAGQPTTAQTQHPT
ncbi:hypothetical protein Psuf_012690 [Phytohabitans suffuscus]|uniref:Uncharacterized protein n=1 Tax=Phytohabitans suffuscus TaxID=624315 RepID=A0A6F8YCX8_9ACTN|nr:hypothetical protein Psuf_012690 [Phytohabitans suffuscus]